MHRIVVITVIAALSVSAILVSPASASSPATWHVQAGSAAFAQARQLVGGGNQFYPNAISIHAGDKVDFTPVGPHTVTFSRPPGPVFALFGPINATPTAGTIGAPGVPVSSGIIGEGPGTYTLTFASTLPAGTYTVICGLHIGMTETVTVVPASEALPATDAQYGEIAERQIKSDLKVLKDIRQDAKKDNDDENTVWVGAGDDHGSNLRFFPGSITVHVGQSITFLKAHDPTEPHTVTFGNEPANPLLQLMPRGGSTYNGVEDVSSGFMSTPAQYAFYQLAFTPLPVALLTYTLTFTKAGDFDYFCALHDQAGMRAVIHVVN